MGRTSRVALVTFENEIAWGVRSIAELLRSRGVDVPLYFLERYTNIPHGVPEMTLNCFLEDFAPRSGDVVGISFTTPHLETARTLAGKVKGRGALVVVGGIHPTILPGDCTPFADYVIRGAGEDAMLALLEALESENPPDKGVFYKGDEFWFNEDVTQLPYPRYGDEADNIIVGGRLSRTYKVPRRIGPITRYQTFTSFGCPYSCTYCVNPLLHVLSKRYGKKFLRRRSIESVIAELRHVKDRIDTVSFEDEDFLIDTDRAMALLDLYQKEINLPFSCLITPSTLKLESLDRLARRLREAKCVSIAIGLQSASPRTAKLFRRPFDLDWLQKVAQAFSRHHIVVTYDVILGNPFEDETDVSQTVDAILSLPHPYDVNIFYLTFFPGYVLTTKAKEQGIVVGESGDTRTPHPNVGLEERIIRLAEIPFIPRGHLRRVYQHRTARWAQVMVAALGRTLLPLWGTRWLAMLRIGWSQPYLIFSIFKQKLSGPAPVG